jgi:hypothetical protein
MGMGTSRSRGYINKNGEESEPVRRITIEYGKHRVKLPKPNLLPDTVQQQQHHYHYLNSVYLPYYQQTAAYYY